ncbi:MAG: ABC transporter ATP-binding protein [Dysgonamonadaceae bacterium]|jgi:ABC-2 type transport system ATP-binding protein|nr:ABC transporter ATP-binding protein [Dysgonamonadaceae bacterium]
MNTQPVIQCENITHYYGNRLIYRDLNFEVQRGKILGLLGKNGTGKTTIINILNGFLKPRSGTCKLFGEKMDSISPKTRNRVGILLEGHVQHSYFNVEQIEKYYAGFFPQWDKNAYYNLIDKLHVTRKQKINTMSCGQRSQVALGLLFAQHPDILILDDFSMGLDPGYRRLFVEKIKEFAANDNKTVFLTSHIIQDMERLIDDCIILDYGKILLHEKTQHILNTFKRFTFKTNATNIPNSNILHNTEKLGDRWETYSFENINTVRDNFSKHNINVDNITEEKLSLEDAFIGLTGKY